MGKQNNSGGATVCLNRLKYMQASVLLLVVCFGHTIFAKGEISKINSHFEQATESNYPATQNDLNGQNGHFWGEGDNTVIDGFELGGERFESSEAANTVVIRRTNTDKACGLFAETTTAGEKVYAADFPGTGSDCDLATLMSGQIINRGALDLFNNTDDNKTKNNIERIDFIFTRGLLAPAVANLASAGHVIAEKGGNNAVKIAAILELGNKGIPSKYGPLIEIKPRSACNSATDICYGTNLIDAKNYDFLYSSDGKSPQIIQAQSKEALGMAFVPLDILGVPAGSRYYGFSYFAADVPASADLTDFQHFPPKTRATRDGRPGDADIYGGTAGFYAKKGLTSAPVADDDTASTSPGQAVTINVLKGDKPTSGRLTVTITVPPANGTATVNQDNSITYTPNPGFIGPNDQFEYELQNSSGKDTAKVTINLSENGSGNNSVGSVDTDGDGIINRIDIDDDNDGIVDAVEGDNDFDGDGVINRLDPDSDGDGINDFEESGLLESRQDPLDSDADGHIDPNQNFGSNGLATALAVIDKADYNGDGKADNPIDTDGDTHPDFLDLDSDNDGISDQIEAGIDPANQPATNHPLDSDNNANGGGIADYRDLDSDNDGLSDFTEAGGSDSDGDGMVDGFLDNDNNGLHDAFSSSPLPIQDTDGDKHANYRDLDSDNDGIPDVFEAGGTDDNLDGLIDNFIEKNDKDGIADSVNTRTGGQKLPDLDSDNDGSADRLDIDSDNDGIMDLIEIGMEDTDGNGMVDNFNDANSDGYDDNARAALGTAGTIPDANNNGIPDYRECDCVGQKLQSGLKGHGAGSADWLVLSLLLFMLAWRKRLPFATIISSLVLLSVNAQAESLNNHSFNERWYLGASGGYSFLDPEPQCLCYTVSDNNDLGYSVFLGRDMGKYLSLEAYYADLGKADIDRNDAPAGSIGYQHFGVSMLGYFYNRYHPINDHKDEGFLRREGLSLFARAGLGKMDNTTDLPHERIEDIHVHLGAGLEYGWNNGFAGRVELVSYDEDAKMISFGILKRFGASQTAFHPAEKMTYQAPKTLQPTPELGAKPEELPPSYSTLIVDQMPMHVFLPIVYFKDNTWELTDESRQELDELVKTMAKQKGMRISIRGHTDSDGNDAVNHTLSRRRAAFVAHYLQSKGIQAGRMQTAAFGASMPIADNTTKEGKQLNRRVDFEIIE